jgi:hypothetical protein
MTAVVAAAFDDAHPSGRLSTLRDAGRVAAVLACAVVISAPSRAEAVAERMPMIAVPPGIAAAVPAAESARDAREACCPDDAEIAPSDVAPSPSAAPASRRQPPIARRAGDALLTGSIALMALSGMALFWVSRPRRSGTSLKEQP